MKEEPIFNQVLEQPPHQREAFLAAACGGDSDLHQRVAALLAAQANPGSFLQAPAAGISPTIDQAPAERPGTLIGPYKLLEKIGEGGMGLVYMAEQQQPVRRLVALKLIKPGLDSQQVIARFEAERQALAMMDHPNIARIYDAGTVGQSTKSEIRSTKQFQSTNHKAQNEEAAPVSDIGPSNLEIVCDLELGHCDLTAGRPFFVMELVRGIPINEFCEQERLTIPQRLALFIQVCQAVQHAHQKGIIHRDLKPSNVLVSRHDTTPIVKIIDFGVAKALGQSLTDKTLFTGMAQMIGTPLYMSPEQAGMSDLDVDTRSDIYSLGVLLYELLTGTTPFDKERLKSVGFDEMRRIIREEEPETVSQRLARTRTDKPGVDAGAKLSRREGTAAKRWSAATSELDWIVMQALEKDRSRRYESASALAADIQRYLSDEPVLACPPTAMYRFQKFARKHKPALVTAAAIALCLLLGTTVSAWQAARATTAEAQANANANQAQEKAQEATTQRDEARTLAEKLQAALDQLRRTTYTAQINLARHAWEAGATDQVVDLLEQHRPKPGETDLRGFEWYYLYRLCHSELLTLQGHTKAVTSVAYSPDGKRLASSSTDNTAKLWDAQTGKELHSLKGHAERVNQAVFSPDSNRVASASSDGTVKVWNSQTGQELLTFKGHTGEVWCVDFSPDGKRLASGSCDYKDAAKSNAAVEVKVWDTETGIELLTFKGHTPDRVDSSGGIDSVVFSPDGTHVVSHDWSGTIKVWDAQTGQELLSKKQAYYPAALSPDGKRLASGSTVWDAQTGKEILSLKGFAQRLVFSPDGKRLAGSSKADKTVRVFDAQTGNEVLSFKGHTASSISVAYNPDGKRLASASSDGTIKIWDAAASPEPLTISEHNYAHTRAAYGPDGKRLAGASRDNTVKVWDAQTGRELLACKGHTGSIWKVTFSPDGKRLASSAGDNTARVWDAQTGQELLIFQGHTSNQVTSVAFSPDGKRMATSAHDRTLKVWDAQTGQELLTLRGHTANIIDDVAFSPDGKLLASGGTDRTVRLWNAETGQELLVLKGHTSYLTSVAFSPDGKRLASSDHGGAVMVWNAVTGQELLSLKGHASTVWCVGFSPDGKRLATCSGDNTTKVWDSQTGQELLTLKSRLGRTMVFSPDGHHLAGPGSNGLQIWDATPLPEKP